MTFPGRDLAKIGLPPQIIGALIVVIALFLRHFGHEPLGWTFVKLGGATHVVGDTLFFFQMKKQKCL